MLCCWVLMCRWRGPCGVCKAHRVTASVLTCVVVVVLRGQWLGWLGLVLQRRNMNILGWLMDTVLIHSMSTILDGSALVIGNISIGNTGAVWGGIIHGD